MPKTYEHTFNDLGGQSDEPTDTQVDLGNPEQRQDATGATINPSPGNPDKGRADQFGDLGGKKAPDTDEGIDIVDGGQQQDADTDTDEDALAGGDDDLKDLSQSARQRIQRERRLREEAESRQRETEARFAELNTKIDLQSKESEWRSADEKDDANLTELKAKKAAAMEAGETAKVVDLDDKITDLKADKRARDSERTKLREAAKKPAAAATDQGKKLHPKAEAWIEAHPQYKNNASFRAAAVAADALLYQSGQNLNSDQYYVKLTKVLADQGFDIKPDDPYLKNRKPARPGPRGGGSDGVRGGQTNTQVNRDSNGRTRVVITKEDKAMAASMGLDVSDPNVLRNLAREKVAQARAERSE